MVTFVGTSHIDPDGHGRLARVLDTVRPEIILLEVSRLSVFFRWGPGRIYRYFFARNLRRAGVAVNRELNGIEAHLGLPYEYRAVKDYCRQSGALYRLIDSSLATLLRYPCSWRLATRKNIETAAGIDEDRFARERTIAARIFRGSDPLLASGAAPVFRPLPAAIKTERLAALREYTLYNRVQRALSRYGNRRIAYVGGWEHCTDDPEGLVLYSRIKGPKERVIIFL